MQREKDDLQDTHYRRDFLTYDNQILDGEIFLQVRTYFYVMYNEHKSDRQNGNKFQKIVNGFLPRREKD